MTTRTTTLRAAAAVTAATACLLAGCTSTGETDPEARRTGSSGHGTASESSKPSRPADDGKPSDSASASSGPGRQDGAPWNLDRIDQRTPPLNGAFTTEATGKGVTAYVIDTGLDIKHRAFGGRASLGADFFDEPDASDCPASDGTGHGTFVAGIVAGDPYGVAPEARLVRVQGIRCGEGRKPLPDGVQDTKLIQAVDWVRTHAKKPAVVNMSINQKGVTKAVDAAVRRLIASGVSVVVSAGNYGDDACKHSPAGVREAVVVAASTRRGRAWQESDENGSGHGRCVDLYAPGDHITSAWYEHGDATHPWGATSWAAPHVTGAAALYLSAHPRATPGQVESWLVDHASRGVLKKVPPDTPNRFLNVSGL
ncbi:S8 family peptidase [Streptomyces sp. NPDC047108]|uniref:S8 family peptidase n=1 Tax=Streptomyces sp. NPDC047108 TaxID=3155025 RepID=UPI0033D75C04